MCRMIVIWIIIIIINNNNQHLFVWTLNIQHEGFCFFSSSSFFETERKYGCYRLGIFVAMIIVMLLILGTIPVTLIIKNNQIVLISLCATLVFVAILLSLFIFWQQKQAKRQREWSTRPFTQQKQNKVSPVIGMEKCFCFPIFNSFALIVFHL